MIGSFFEKIMATSRGGSKFSPDLITPLDSDFKYPLVQVPGKFAIQAWGHLDQDDSHTPIIIGSHRHIEYIAEGMEYIDQRPVDQILDEVSKLDFPEGLKAVKLKEYRALSEDLKGSPGFEGLIGKLERDFDLSIDPADILVDWPSGRAPKNKQKLPSIAMEWETEKPLETTIVALLPTSDWTEAPAYMSFGNYNDCPAPEWHVAALQYWKARLDFKLVGISHETLDLRVSTRPQNRDEAVRYAIELYCYCPDLVEQGSGSIAELARDLMNNEWWDLWWD